MIDNQNMPTSPERLAPAADLLPEMAARRTEVAQAIASALAATAEVAE